MVHTILMAVSKWTVDNLGVMESLKNVGMEVLNKTLWTPLKEKIINFFDTDKEAETFIKKISESKAINVQKPYRDIEDVYENIKGILPPKELFDATATFFLENPDIIKEANSHVKINNSVMISQTAGRDIVNVKKAKILKINNH